ncbi:uncharacterized protein LOC9642876 [Selaginella moellendorffii]|nr:uncharacterized protein LOC9642876 [Selaginella moellendorffii]|eukprot:XP_002986873.2 uncharacterized protein LOC9642876 [Selaginella moellendorffii]
MPAQDPHRDDADPLTKLILRAQAFRDKLAESSSRHRESVKSIERSSQKDASLEVDLILAGAGAGDDNSRLLGLGNDDEKEAEEEAALLQELFFSRESTTTTATTRSTTGTTEIDPRNDGLCLLVTIGKVVLLDETVEDLTKIKPSILCHFGSTISMLSSCTCLLTLFFPAVFDAQGLKLCPEQRISVTPVTVQKRMLLFDYRSQLFWKLASTRVQQEWCAQPVKTTLYLRWQSGEALECYGYVSLNNAIQVGGLQTSLVLAAGKSIKDDVHPAVIKPTRYKTKASSVEPVTSLRSSKSNIDLEGRAIATVDIGMVLVGESSVGAAPKKTSCYIHAGDEQEPWIYLNLHNLGAEFTRVQSARSQTMLLVVKSGCRVAFASIRLSRKNRYRQKFLDAVLQPSPSEECLIFLEAWDSLRAYEGLGEGGLEGLLGMLKVPYSLGSWTERTSRHGIVKFSGCFRVWHPSKKSVSGKVTVIVVLGLRYQVLKIQKENQAAAVIQSCFRKFLFEKSQLKEN